MRPDSMVVAGRPDRPRGCRLDLPLNPATERMVDDERYDSTWPLRPAELKASGSPVPPAGSLTAMPRGIEDAPISIIASCP